MRMNANPSFVPVLELARPLLVVVAIAAVVVLTCH